METTLEGSQEGVLFNIYKCEEILPASLDLLNGWKRRDRADDHQLYFSPIPPNAFV